MTFHITWITLLAGFYVCLQIVFIPQMLSHRKVLFAPILGLEVPYTECRYTRYPSFLPCPLALLSLVLNLSPYTSRQRPINLQASPQRRLHFGSPYRTDEFIAKFTLGPQFCFALCFRFSLKPSSCIRRRLMCVSAALRRENAHTWVGHSVAAGAYRINRFQAVNFMKQ